MARKQSPTSVLMSKRRQIRNLENELDKHVLAEQKAKLGKRTVREQLRLLRSRGVGI